MDMVVYLGKRACLEVTSGDIGAQSPRAIDPMSPLVPSKHALNRYETAQKFNKTAF